MDKHTFDIGTRVKILTPAGGCYDQATGTVTAKLDGNMNPYEEPGIPHFYRVRTDVPVDLGDGTPCIEDVHPSRQVFPIDTKRKNYWHVPTD